MNLLVDVVAVVGLSGVIAMSVLAPAIGGVMPVLILVGLIDGPTGGRLASASARRRGRVTAPTHAEERDADSPTPDRPAA